MMGPGFLLLVLAQLAAPTDLVELRARFLQGDLVSLERARGILVERGEDVTRGSIALLEDLSRLARCLPLGPIPKGESDPYQAARLLVRLERVRLESLIKDGLYRRTPLFDLLGEPPLFQTHGLDQPDLLVKWPLEQERWPGEVADARLEPVRCPGKPGVLKESDKKVHAAARQARARAIRELLASLVERIDRLPGEARAKVATSYLRSATRAEHFDLPADWDRALYLALKDSPPPWRSAGWIMIARLREQNGDKEGAIRLYREILDGGHPDDLEDSRVRARLAGLLEPNFEAVLQIARDVRAPRSQDLPVLANAEARALYALGRFEELKSFGRTWLRRKEADNEFDVSTRDLLVKLSLELDPPEAMQWMEEIGPGDPRDRQSRLDQLGKLALENNNIDLATRIYDRLRAEAIEQASTRGPAASADRAHWIAERARIEFAVDDAEAFADFIDEILALAQKDTDRPLARFAPHREVGGLCQDLIGRIANEVDSRPERRKFAALLLEAAVTLSDKPSRWQAMLERYAESLKTLAGPYALGREVRAPLVARKPAAGVDLQKRRKERARKVRELGEVVIPRLPERLVAGDVPTPVPAPGSFVVYEDLDGAWRSGAPWAPLAEKRGRAQKPRK